VRILAYAASNSSRSINGRLVGYAKTLLEEGLIPDCTVDQVYIHHYETPIYSIDRQEEGGIPDPVQAFFAEIGEADGLVISFAEHNGYYTAAYKNLYDWMSRIDRKVYQGKPTVMFATAPGGRGATRVLEHAVKSAANYGADLRGSLSIPDFNDNFDRETGRLANLELDRAFHDALARLAAR
jgi:NAD(P)H-dependent FMN reductase